ncbi:MAG: IPExxxVDY family protein [Bacteroidota bacterium]
MAVHKISEDFYEDSFALIAVHSSMEDYAMAYTINLHLKCNLQRSRTDLDVSRQTSFPIFEWKDLDNDAYWTLISNNGKKKEEINENGLFQDHSSYSMYYLIPEHKEVDYFLKIDQENISISDTIIDSILGIPRVIMAYTVETSTLKSKNNLIF